MSENGKLKILRSCGSLMIILLVIYVMSFGPVLVFLEDQYGQVPRVYHARLEMFYAPVIGTLDRSDLFARFYTEYYELIRFRK
ncbi:hypothetical protein [Gimesia algae]|uniref:Uncharacterized protein n=1 Tax=Gimesia algae TaxID=2527971 RepID=A0A517V7I8_9PLAN|nr:hypothetical protein [Gimesia algae]QDT88965.1 hypothetical protein Pan161_05840 [Gimesia algae]